MALLTTVLLVAAVAMLAALVYLQTRRRPDTGVLMLQQQIDGLRAQVEESGRASSQAVAGQVGQLQAAVTAQVGEVSGRMADMTGRIGERLDNAARVIGEVKQGIGEIRGASDRLAQMSAQMLSLQEILGAPKTKGLLGELMLEELLRQVLPPGAYGMQHRFRNNQAVDAVVRAGDRLVPIDAKFPLDNFRRIQETGDVKAQEALRKAFLADVRKHVESISQKYILPDEGTFDFALMYIPSEAVYYEFISARLDDGGERDPVRFAHRKHVFPVSPSTLLAYLQTIALGLRGMQVEKNARETIERLHRLGHETAKIQELLGTLGKHLADASKKYDEIGRGFSTLSAKIGEIHTDEHQEGTP